MKKMQEQRGPNDSAPNAANDSSNSNTAGGANTTNATGTGAGFSQAAPVFGAKQDDPLIKAETEKKVNEQKGQLEV